MVLEDVTHIHEHLSSAGFLLQIKICETGPQHISMFSLPHQSQFPLKAK